MGGMGTSLESGVAARKGFLKEVGAGAGVCEWEKRQQQRNNSMHETRQRL